MKKYTLYHVSDATLFEADGNGTLPGRQFYDASDVEAERLILTGDNINLRARIDELEQAARAVVDRWGTPHWKDVPATAGYINALRSALGKFAGDSNG